MISWHLTYIQYVSNVLPRLKRKEKKYIFLISNQSIQEVTYIYIYIYILCLFFIRYNNNKFCPNLQERWATWLFSQRYAKTKQLWTLAQMLFMQCQVLCFMKNHLHIGEFQLVFDMHVNHCSQRQARHSSRCLGKLRPSPMSNMHMK